MSEWFEKSFGDDYLRVYAHRNEQHADAEMKWLQNTLGLSVGARVLDFCCGNGRHARAIAEMGCAVTGFDLSQALLRVAKEKDIHDRIHWIQGDARNVPIQDQFDVIVNLFTSFGYFQTDAEHVQVLKEFRRLLKPGGKWVVDFLNAVSVKKQLVPYNEKEINGFQVREKRWIEAGRVNKTIQLTDEQGTQRNYLESVRLYELEDMKKLCTEAGLCIESIYGDFQGHAFDEQSSPRLILIGTVN